MTLSPMRSMGMKKIDQKFFFVENEGVVSLVLPSYVHGRGTKISIPCIPNVLADGVKKVVHRESFQSTSVEQHIVGKQSEFVLAA